MFKRHSLGENSYGGTPGHISNPEVKPVNAEGTWWEAARENRNLPSYMKRGADVPLFFIYNKKKAAVSSLFLFILEWKFIVIKTFFLESRFRLCSFRL